MSETQKSEVVNGSANDIDNSPSATSSSIDENLANRKKRNRIIIISLIIFALIAVAIGVLWILFYKGYESTEDAYVSGNVVVLSSRQDGCILSYHAEDADYVEEGEVLVCLDPTDYLASVEQKKNSLALAARQVLNLYEDAQQKKANVVLEEAKYNRADLNMTNRTELAQTEAIAQEDYQDAKAEFKITKAALDLAKHQLEAAEALLGTTQLQDHPTIENAKIELFASYLALQRCTIVAPVSGFIANRNVQVGQSVKASEALMDIVPLNALWVEANFKETQLENIRIGQPVKMTADIYGSSIVYHGKVGGLLPGSGSVFSLLPAQNATGNWIKIVQRVPIRILLDSEEVKKHPLVLGLTLYATVDVKNTDGKILADKKGNNFVKTSIYQSNMQPIEDIVNRIIHDNLRLPIKKNTDGPEKTAYN